MSALVLDAGALVAVDRDDRAMIARLRVAARDGLELRSNAMVVAPVWRDRQGRQVNLARLLRAVDVLLAAPGDRILTSDPGDLSRLAAAAANQPVIVAC